MNIWRARFAARAGVATVAVGSTVVAGSELVAGAERWAAAFRHAGLMAGDRLVTALPSGAGLAQVLLAGLWEGLTLVPLPPGADLAVAADEADPAAGVAGPGSVGPDEGWAWSTEGTDGPGAPPDRLRPAGPRSPQARLLCAPSGTGPWAALLDDNLEHAVDAVLAALQPEGARWLSVLPWDSAAGLLLDLLPALLGAQTIVRPDADALRSVPDVANVMQRWQPSHAVLPLPLVRSLQHHWAGLAPLHAMLGGLVSGPGLDASLAAELRRTRLRTHRGAPELSCMVTLGEPGVWRPGALGRPVGCTIVEGPGGSLLVSGRPVAGGRWVGGTLQLVDRRSPVLVALA